MSFWESVINVFSNYATFSGRALRSEYWYFFLFFILVNLFLNILSLGDMPSDAFILKNNGTILNNIFFFVTFIPGLAVFARRLHDVNRSGWWFLLVFIPILGWIPLLVWLFSRGTDGPNRFGT